MKRMIGFLLAGLMTLGMTAMAAADVTPVPTLYKGDDLVYALDGAIPTLYEVASEVSVNGELVKADVSVQVIDGVTMVPLRAPLEALGYTVKWNPESKSVEILKGAQWTSVTLGVNGYFRNKMAPHELSAAPVLVDNRTLLPLEFFADILGIATNVDTKNIDFTDMEAVIHSGYIKSIAYDETGMKTLTLTSDYASDNFELQVIIHTGEAYTFYQKEVKEGDYVNVVSSMIMTMSLPGQTSGYVVY